MAVPDPIDVTHLDNVQIWFQIWNHFDMVAEFGSIFLGQKNPLSTATQYSLIVSVVTRLMIALVKL